VSVRHRLDNLDGMSRTAWAEDIARSLLEEPLPRRWAHVQAVAGTARGLSTILGKNAELLTAAAVLHDIGYSPSLRDSGFHSLDGARYLRDVQHADGMLCRLVAHHSCAIAEAEEYGLAADLAGEFKAAPRSLADALIYCDMTTGPDGQRMTVDQRLADIRARYGPAHPVTNALRRSAPELIAATARVTRKLSARMEIPRAIRVAPALAC
jgi:HD domain